MSKSIKLYNSLAFKDIDYESENLKRVNNILFILNDAIFALMELNTKVSKAIINDNNEILNAVTKCPTYKDFMINRHMIGKLKNKNNDNIKFINIDNIFITIKDLENIFITIHDNYQINKMTEPKFYNDFHKGKNILDYVIETYGLNEEQKKVLFIILDKVTLISKKNLKLTHNLFLELGYFIENDFERFSKEFQKNNCNKEEVYIPKLMEMKDLVDNKNLLKGIKNRVDIFEKYLKATEKLLELLPLDIIEIILN